MGQDTAELEAREQQAWKIFVMQETRLEREIGRLGALTVQGGTPEQVRDRLTRLHKVEATVQEWGKAWLEARRLLDHGKEVGGWQTRSSASRSTAAGS